MLWPGCDYDTEDVPPYAVCAIWFGALFDLNISVCFYCILLFLSLLFGDEGGGCFALLFFFSSFFGGGGGGSTFFLSVNGV